MHKIYLDNNATTAVAPKVAAAIVEELKMAPSNPSSVHHFGKEAAKRLTRARESIAEYLDVRPSEIIFNSGATEGLNHILRTAPPGHIITSNIEHSCVDSTLKQLEQQGREISFLSCGSWGALTPLQVEEALRPNTRMIVLSAVNSETGVKTDIEAIATLCEKKGILFIVDAVALIGKENFSIPYGVSAMAFSGHKIHGPKGVGLVFVRSNYKIAPFITGGEQELGRRAGTENLPGIIGLAASIIELKTALPRAGVYMQNLREIMEKQLKQAIPHLQINGEGPRVSNTSNLFIPEGDGETLLLKLDMEGIAVSHGSACSSGTLEPSRVLINMGYSRTRARSSIRVSLSRMTTEEEIETFIKTLTKLLI